jgi:hypothetical protein
LAGRGEPLRRIGDAIRDVAAAAQFRDSDAMVLMAARMLAPQGLQLFLLKRAGDFAAPIASDLVFEAGQPARPSGWRNVLQRENWVNMTSAGVRREWDKGQAAHQEQRGPVGASAILSRCATQGQTAEAFDNARALVSWLAIRQSDVQALIAELQQPVENQNGYGIGHAPAARAPAVQLVHPTAVEKDAQEWTDERMFKRFAELKSEGRKAPMPEFLAELKAAGIALSSRQVQRRVKPFADAAAAATGPFGQLAVSPAAGASKVHKLR